MDSDGHTMATAHMSCVPAHRHVPRPRCGNRQTPFTPQYLPRCIPQAKHVASLVVCVWPLVTPFDHWYVLCVCAVVCVSSGGGGKWWDVAASSANHLLCPHMRMTDRADRQLDRQ